MAWHTGGLDSWWNQGVECLMPLFPLNIGSFIYFFFFVPPTMVPIGNNP